MTHPFFRRWRSASALVLSVAALALSPLHAAPKTAAEAFNSGKPVIFRDHFQSDSIAEWNISEDDRYNIPANTPDRLKIVDAPGLTGHKAVQFTVPRAPNSFRSELSLPHENTFCERWYSERILVPEDWVIEHYSKGNDIVMQWHAIPGNWKATYPNLEISVGGDHWFVRRSFGSARTPTRTNDTLDTIQPGHWVSWVIHAKWSPGDDGLLQLWKDGKLVMETKGPNVYSDIGIQYTPYMKTGIYHPEWHLDTDRKRTAFEADKPDATTRVIYATDIKVGGEHARLEDMTPGH